jgi:hypothetical protein
VSGRRANTKRCIGSPGRRAEGSAADENKINAFQEIFRQQLLQYKMGSVDPRELNISRDNYAPELGELNLRADVSGSDLIRLQWAYLIDSRAADHG